ncbi:hypothetical protein PISMIDRAFT_681703 [Pisolithus microcarpus 441]|uniref:Uncharacterized protein n=1 Tax=Pisolithus microcarpus 441 TaxID=765257 RepID=A0A0C9ZFA3_9AGAM|nr:hypothetical protein PISMIDRAFT_681703 [Pisolithus microcarpus 441]
MLNATELHIDNPCAAPCSPNVSPKQCSVRIQESHHPPAPVFVFHCHCQLLSELDFRYIVQTDSEGQTLWGGQN